MIVNDAAQHKAFYADLMVEIDRARKLHPGNKELLAALVEEVGEVAKALQEKHSRESLYEECVQVAAVAFRIAHEGDASFPLSVPSK